MEFEQHCWAEVNLDAIVHNFKLIQSRAGGAQVCAVVKAGAYGHGDDYIAKAVQEAGAKWFAVSCLSEALHLRSCGIKGHILILGRTDPDSAPLLAEYHLTQAVYSPEYARLLGRYVREGEVHVHLKVDTGMGRIGFVARSEEDIAPCAQALSQCFEISGIRVTGMFQHFAVADSHAPQDIEYTNRQHALFLAVRDALTAMGRPLRTVHCCNSAAFVEHPEWAMDLIRPGILLYGHDPSEEVHFTGLKPALTLKAAVSQVKDLLPGQALSYGLKYTADTTRRVATLCVGYADGYPRAMTNRGLCALHGKPAPVIGRVCMDQMMVDVTDIPCVQPGDEAIIYGPGGVADTTADVASKVNTIPYEIICGLTLRVPRVYIKNGVRVGITDYLKQMSRLG